MLKFIFRRFYLMFLTMFLVSIAVFLITEASPGNVARNVLGSFVTPEQEKSFLNQMGLDEPAFIRYIYWLIGSEWIAEKKIGMELTRLTSKEGFQEWWAIKNEGTLIRWKMKGEELTAIEMGPDKKITTYKDDDRWKKDNQGAFFFWGVNDQNQAVKWEKGKEKEAWRFIVGTGWMKSGGAPTEYIPIKKGFIRGDPGVSLRTGRPVSKSLGVRLRNSLVLAGSAFVFVMPIALFLGILAGLKEGSLLDRGLSIPGMMFSVIPEFVTGIFLILILSQWLDLVPGATVFGEKAPWTKPDMLILPVLTLALIELGYILRITRASMTEVMQQPFVRTGFLKGLPFWQVVFKHAVRNALIAPITVIMLHINWMMSGIVIVEVVFGYPGLGKYLLDSALYKDVAALEAGAMIMVLIAVGTQLIADILYTFLNPRIRYT